MTKEDIFECIYLANDNLSRLTYREKNILGLLPSWTRHFISNLVAPDRSYCEVGVFMAATLVAAATSTTGKVTGIDNWYFDSHQQEYDNIKDQVMGIDFWEVREEKTEVAAKTHIRETEISCTLHEQDVMDSDPGPHDILYFDGDHNEEPTRDGLLRMIDRVQPQVVLVDDYCFQGVLRGAQAAIPDYQHLEVVNAWNQVGIYLL